MATLLVGRCVQFRIMPFSFLEAYDFMKLNRKDVVQDEFIFDYINWGGFPLRFSFTQEREVKTYLEQTYNGIIDKDIVTECSKVNREKFTKIASYIIANAGNDSPKHASCWFI